MCKDAIGGNPENNTILVGTAPERCSVKIAIAGLHQSGLRIGTVMAVGEGIKRSLYAIGGDPENNTIADGAACQCCSVQIAVAGLHQSGLRRFAVTAAIGKRIKRNDLGAGLADAGEQCQSNEKQMDFGFHNNLAFPIWFPAHD